MVRMKYHRLEPEKILYISNGFILSLLLGAGILWYCWKINIIDYLPNITLCPFHMLTGKLCPGCGMSRAFLLLGQLKINDALEMNLFSVPLLFLMITYFAFRRVPLWLQNKYFVHISLFAVLVYWIVRLFNI